MKTERKERKRERGVTLSLSRKSVARVFACRCKEFNSIAFPLVASTCTHYFFSVYNEVLVCFNERLLVAGPQVATEKNVRGAGKENGKVAARDGPRAGRCNGMRKKYPKKRKLSLTRAEPQQSAGAW